MLTDPWKEHFKYTPIRTYKPINGTNLLKLGCKKQSKTFLSKIPTDSDTIGKVTSHLGRHHFEGNVSFRVVFQNSKPVERYFFFK